MAKHFARCFGANQRSREFEFWNDLRTSVVGYLITSQPEFAKFELFSRDHSLPRLLRHMASSNAAAVKRSLKREPGSSLPRRCRSRSCARPSARPRR